MNTETKRFLDSRPTNNLERATQQIIVSHSKTHLLQLERALRKLDQALYNSELKQLTLNQIYAAITYSKSLVCDTQPEPSASTSTQEK